MTQYMSRLVVIAVSVVMFGAATPRVHAGPVVTLDDLLKGKSLQVGELVFSNFGNFSSVGFLGGQPVDPKLVTVLPTMFDGAPGLLFQSPSQFMVGLGQQQQTHFTFNVVASANLIAGAGLSLTAAAYGGGTATIAGSFSAIPNGLFVSTLIPQNYAYGSINAPLASITVSKDITLVGGHQANSSVLVSGFMQSFDTKPGSGAVPEPASLALFSIGIIALVGYRWRAARTRRAVAA
jgi:hypothetical protein